MTVNHEAGVWYVSILCRIEDKEISIPKGEPIGVDLGTAVALFQSNGITPYVPVTKARSMERTKRLQQRISRCKKGSANRRKAVRSLGRRKAKEARRRRDALHKASSNLAKNHSLIGIEDLRIKNMTASAAGTMEYPGTNVAQKSGLNRAILDRGWGIYAGMLGYKTRWYGSRLVAVPPMYSSQECSACGYVNALNRVSRDTFMCVECGHAEHADWNASKVICSRAITIVMNEEASPEDTCLGSACGALCTKQGDEAGNEGRKAGSSTVLNVSRSESVNGGE